jgi:hypothetical protein
MIQRVTSLTIKIITRLNIIQLITSLTTEVCRPEKVGEETPYADWDSWMHDHVQSFYLERKIVSRFCTVHNQ